MNKRDFILIAVVLLTALTGFFIFNSSKSEGNQVTITLDGEKYGTYSLNDNQKINIPSEFGTNIVVIKNGIVYMEDADCPDKYCVNQGEISTSRDSIICLPHKLVVEIESSDNNSNDFDVIVR